MPLTPLRALFKEAPAPSSSEGSDFCSNAMNTSDDDILDDDADEEELAQLEAQAAAEAEELLQAGMHVGETLDMVIDGVQRALKRGRDVLQEVSDGGTNPDVSRRLFPETGVSQDGPTVFGGPPLLGGYDPEL